MQVNSVKKTSPLHGYKGFMLCLLLVFFTGPVITTLTGQCTTTSSLSIPDDGTASVKFIVSGLVDNDLASPSQGICEVNIDFMHEYLGDLTMTLISPSGFSIELIGQVTTAITPTNLSRWNIRFIPCMTMPLPDAGFTPVWSNLQLWQAFTPYSGSYHPHSGCLEDFNSGPANGVWQLIIEDHDVFQIGTLASATIIFCNPTGLQCAECNPNAGILSPAAITRCIGQNISSSEIMVDFGGNPPPPSFYSYLFLMTMGNTIVRSGSFFSDTPPPGNYSICGLSYLTVDSMEVNNLLAAGDYNQFIQAISSGAICADISSPCVNINVMPVPDTTFMDIFLCQDESFVFKGQLYSTNGIYYILEDGIGLCDSVFRLIITSSNLVPVILTPDSITCGGSGAVLDGSGSQGGIGPISYEWSTEAGIINGNLNNSQVIALVPGIYKLTVKDSVCEASGEVIVHGDVSYPKIFVEGGEITCDQSIFTIHPVAIPSNVTYSWSGPGGFASTMKDINVTMPGRYFLQIESVSGCRAFTYVDVVDHTSPPDATILLFDKVCTNGLGVIGASSANSLYEWEGPSGSLPLNQMIVITEAGNYSLTLTDPMTGCMGTGTYFFDADFAIPSILITGVDSIRCNQDVSLMVSPNGISGVPQWSGPNSFVTLGFDQSFSQPGTYIISVLGTNGCRNTDTIELFASNEYPDYEVTNDTVSCLETTATIGISMPGADIYNWVGFNGPDSSDAFVQVSQPGIYFVTALDTNAGCIITATANVFSDLSQPVFSFLTDAISCNEPIATLIFQGIPGQEYTEIYWQFPDMTIIANLAVSVTEPGDYVLTVTGKNGCLDSSLVTVGADTIPPIFFLEADTLQCDLKGIIDNIRVDSLIGITWTGPGMFTSVQLSPMVTDTGLYIANGFGENGCSSQVPVYVYGDFEPPVSLLSLDALTCLSPFAVFIATSNDSVIAFEWKDPLGNIIGTDSAVNVSNPGTYTIQLEGTNHCKSLDSLHLEPTIYPLINVVTDTFTCEMLTMTIAAGSNVTNPDFIWMNEDGDTLSGINQLDVDYSGPFVISVTGLNGCETLDTILIPIDTVPPVAVLELLGEVRCQNRDIMFDGSASSPDNIEFLWTTEGGSIQGDNTLSVIEARDTGLYILTVLRQDNGCSDLDSFHLTEHPDAISLAFLDIKPTSCSGGSTASIHILGLQGGIQPLLFQLDGGAPQSGDLFGGLNPGNYLLQILDASGCLFDTIVTIETINTYNVDAGPDQEIFLGESTIVYGTNNLLPVQILNQEWDSLGFVFCQDCPDFSVSPLMTTTYRYRVISTTGCILQDEVIIYVIEKGKYFIGNIFSPNGDHINDEVRLHASPGIVKVLKWIIFDRWGNAVFGRTDFDPNDPSVSWDGRTALGGELNPAVFPYLLEVVLLNGAIEIYHGDITLLR